MKIEVLDEKSVISPSAVIHKENVLLGQCVVGDMATLLPYNYIENSVIGRGSVVRQSNITNSTVGENTTVGPFATLRDGAKIGNDCRIGNFVEIKNSTIGDGSKVSHLAYVGDAQVGVDCNIGCGVIFCNYDGKTKNKIVVGDRCFIGSNTILIAPVTIADDTYICAGSVITEDTEKGDFVIGRSRAIIKKGKSGRYFVKHPHTKSNTKE